MCKRTCNEKHKTRVISRNPFKIDDVDEKYVKYYKGDITKTETLIEPLKNAKAVIFAANARNRNAKNDNSQSYSDIATIGIINVANLCIINKISRLVIISASCISCNENGASYDKICGLKCEHCRAKEDGEKAIREIYTNNNDNKIGYTIIRTGLLTKGEKRGVKEIELNQDYTKSGMISRIDLANLCIKTITNENTRDTTFEAYYRDTIQPVDVKKSLDICIGMGKTMEECFFGGNFKNRKPKNLDETLKTPIKDTLFATGNEFNGQTWNELFKKLRKDDKNNNNDLFEIKSGVS